MYRDTAAPFPVLRTTSVATLLLCGLALAWTDSAQALGLGRPQMRTALGQALNIEFPLTLSAGESLSSDCVTAEVLAGSSRLPAAAVRVQLQGASEASVRAIRVLSSVKIEEPIISVTLSLGCPTRLTRQYSALLDPPGVQAQQSVTETAELPQAATPPSYTPAMRAALATTGAKPQDLLAAGEVNAAAVERLSSSPVPATSSKTNQAKVSQSKPKSQGVARSAGSDSKPLLVAAEGSLSAGSSGKASQALDLANAPKLRLEALDSVVSAAVVAQVAASAAEAEAAIQRLQALEAGLGKLREDKRASELKLTEMRTRLAAEGAAAGDAGSVSDADDFWLWGLGALSLGLGAACAYLWQSRKLAQQGVEANWWAATGLGRGGPEEIEPGPGLQEPQSAPQQASAANLATQLQVESETSGFVEPQSKPERFERGDERTISLARLSEGEHLLDFAHPGPTVPGALSSQAELSVYESSEAARNGLARGASAGSAFAQESALAEPLSVQFLDAAHFGEAAPAFGGDLASATSAEHGLVSVEALIDLEQQADFFLVLGQEDAAVDLLQERINSHVDSALPYLKLMEICQKRGEALAFADLAGRYALRFDAIAPTWDQDLSLGRDLEAYAEVMREIQSRWSDSGASMSLLQKLLSNQGARGVNLELPALRDLLLLYSVARDRSEHEVRGQEIDLFLPLESEVSSQTGFGMMATMVWQSAHAGEAATTQAVDVDIVLDEMPPTKP